MEFLASLLKGVDEELKEYDQESTISRSIVSDLFSGTTEMLFTDHQHISNAYALVYERKSHLGFGFNKKILF